VMLVFAVEFAWYLHGLVETCVFDRNRGDFIMMVAHHVLAAILIYFSIIEGGHRVGLYVLATLDFVDIVLYCAKIFHLSTSNAGGKALNSRYQKGQTIALLTVAISWTFSRMIIFSYIVRETYLINIKVHAWSVLFMRVILTLLLAMQWVWGILCWRMVISQLTQGSFVDSINDSHRVEKAKKQ